jgi:hypothetical protein
VNGAYSDHLGALQHPPKHQHGWCASAANDLDFSPPTHPNPECLPNGLFRRKPPREVLGWVRLRFAVLPLRVGKAPLSKARAATQYVFDTGNLDRVDANAKDAQPLLHRDGLREVSRLVDVQAARFRDLVGEELQGQERRDTRKQRVRPRAPQHVLRVLLDMHVAFGRHRNHLSPASADLLNV